MRGGGVPHPRQDERRSKPDHDANDTYRDNPDDRRIADLPAKIAVHVFRLFVDRGFRELLGRASVYDRRQFLGTGCSDPAGAAIEKPSIRQEHVNDIVNAVVRSMLFAADNRLVGSKRLEIYVHWRPFLRNYAASEARRDFTHSERLRVRSISFAFSVV